MRWLVSFGLRLGDIVSPRFAKIPPLRVVVPKEEGMAQNILYGNLLKLCYFIDRFAAAIALYDLCDPANLNPAIPSEHLNHIRTMSGSTGAMTIFNVAMVIRAIKGNLHKTKSLLPLIDTDQLKMAEKVLSSSFPSFDLVRHATAHPAETFSTVERATQNAPTGEFSTPLGKMVNDGGLMEMTDSFVNRTFTSFIEKQVVTYDLTTESHEKLLRVVGCGAVPS